MHSNWNTGIPVDTERKQFTETLINIENFRKFAINNPKFKALPDGQVIQQITEDEWLAKATTDNASDKPIARDSVMSGWKMAETGQMIMQKIGQPMPYTLPEKSSEAPQRADTKPEQSDVVDEPDDTFPFSDRTFDTFSETIKQLESSGRYDIAHGANNHYDGAYGLGRMAKIDAGKRLGIELKHDAESREAFRNDPELQDAAFLAFVESNHETLMRLSGRYRGLSRAKKAEALAVAHLLGSGGAVEYLNGTDGQDAFGTSGGKYAQAVRDALG